jgi:hypothetical protein
LVESGAEDSDGFKAACYAVGIGLGLEVLAVVHGLDGAKSLVSADLPGERAVDEASGEHPPLASVEAKRIAFRQRLERCAVAASEALTHVAPS